MLKVNNLTKKYGDHYAIKNISFSINAGEIVGFLGPNGAGKTTTMNIITGYISSTEGTAEINNIDILNEPEKAKKNIGYSPDVPPVYPEFLVKEYLNFVCEIKGVKKAERKKMLDEVMDLAKIKDVENRLIKNLSRGYKQRVGLAQALLGYPKVIILDEPTNGLDPQQIIEMRDVIKKLSKKHTILLSSHILSEISIICDRVIILNEGQIAASDSYANLSKSFNADNKVLVKIKNSNKDIMKILKENKNVKTVFKKNDFEENALSFDVTPKDKIDLREEIFDICVKNNLTLLELKTYNYALEEIFIELTKKGITNADSEQETKETEKENSKEIKKEDSKSKKNKKNSKDKKQKNESVTEENSKKKEETESTNENEEQNEQATTEDNERGDEN